MHIIFLFKVLFKVFILWLCKRMLTVKAIHRPYTRAYTEYTLYNIHFCGLLFCQISRKSYETPRLTTVGGLLINKSSKQHCIGNKPYDPISINAISLNFRLTYLFNWYVEENTINHIITKRGFIWILAIVDIFFQVHFHLLYGPGSWWSS